MAKTQTLRTNLGIIDGVWLLLATVAGGWGAKNSGIGLLCGIAMGIALGTWRLVQIQGKALEYRQAEYYPAGLGPGGSGARRLTLTIEGGLRYGGRPLPAREGRCG
jgi:hypothetical protein